MIAHGFRPRPRPLRRRCQRKSRYRPTRNCRQIRAGDGRHRPRISWPILRQASLTHWWRRLFRENRRSSSGCARHHRPDTEPPPCDPSQMRSKRPPPPGRASKDSACQRASSMRCRASIISDHRSRPRPFKKQRGITGQPDPLHRLR